MAFMGVSLVEVLRYSVMGQILALKYLLSSMHGLLCYVLSCQALNATAT
jgi:hypothetical protein